MNSYGAFWATYKVAPTIRYFFGSLHYFNACAEGCDLGEPPARPSVLSVFSVVKKPVLCPPNPNPARPTTLTPMSEPVGATNLVARRWRDERHDFRAT